MSDYWAAMAQVIPVVAIGIALEARTISGSWDEKTPRWRRGIQSLIWIFTLIPLALGELEALRALRGRTTAAWWPGVCEAAVAAGISILILSPAIEVFLRGHAESAARLFSWDPLGRVRLWHVDRRILRLIRKTERLRGHGDVLAYEGLAIVRAGREQLRSDEERLARLACGDPGRPSLAAQLGKAREALDVRRAILDDFEARRLAVIFRRRDERHRLAADEADYMRNRGKYLEEWRTVTEEDRQRLIEYFRSFSLASQSPSLVRTAVEPAKPATPSPT